jgi:hypothetical protein
MMRSNSMLTFLFCVIILATQIWASQVEWTRMTGKRAIQTSPLVVDVNGDGKNEIVALNRAGELMLWALDGSAIGDGTDGIVAQMPEGTWPTQPTFVDSGNLKRFLVCSKEGLVVSFNQKFQLLWKHQLPGMTSWGRAVPTLIQASSGLAHCLADHSGTVTCLDLDGKINWTVELEEGPCHHPLQTILVDKKTPAILVPVGSMLCCLNIDGKVLWRLKLDGDISSKPQLLSLQNSELIICSASAGWLYAISYDGKIVWKTVIEEEMDTYLSFLPRPNSPPLILCMGLWGNLHAIDVEGSHIWTHYYRAKSRGAPLVIDADGKGNYKILVATYKHHFFVFDENGNLVDDMRFSGMLNAAPTPITEPDFKGTDALIVTSSLLAHRVRPNLPKSPYRKVGEPKDIVISNPVYDQGYEMASIKFNNPHGAFINANISMTNEQGWTKIKGCVTARSTFEIRCPQIDRAKKWSSRAIVRDPHGHNIKEKSWDIKPRSEVADSQSKSDKLTAWSTPAYGLFNDTRLVPYTEECYPEKEMEICIDGLYLDEVDQGAFIVASTLEKPIRMRTIIEPPTRIDGTAFEGTIVLREVVHTGTVNGERVPDALPALGDAGLFMIPAQHSAKIWISVDTHGAQSGNYKGRLILLPLHGEVDTTKFELNLNILNLKMPEKFPLKVCTWDYLPNNWFPSSTTEVLNDMTRHGINVFPRSASIPKGDVDSNYALTINWSNLDVELERLKGRGEILFQIIHPPINFASTPTDAEKRRIEIEYLCKWRDYMKDRGWKYKDYGFYPIDEPGYGYGSRIPTLLGAAELFREADPKFRIYTDPTFTLSWTSFEQIEPYIDIWCPGMRLVSGLLWGDPRMERIINSGKELWSYECVAQVKSISPLCYNRAHAWRAEYFNLTGIGIWTYSTTNKDMWFAGQKMNDEFPLVYPGTKPTPSVRWEALRDGLEDVSAISLLEHQIVVNEKTGKKPKLVEQAKEILRIAKIDIMELSDAAFIESRDFLRAGDRKIPLTWIDIETFYHHRKNIAEMTMKLKY